MLTINQIKKCINDGNCDSFLAKVYCREEHRLFYHKERIIHAADTFMEIFSKDESCEAAVYSAPGRTEIGGNHTDHQRGKVLTGSVDLDAIACVSPNGKNEVNVYSEGYGMTFVSCDCLDIAEDEKNTTKAIIKGIIRKIKEQGYEIRGFDAYCMSDVPGGSGLSSSACFEVLIGTIINGLFCNMEIPSYEIAKIGQYAENVYFGKPSGLLDQMGCSIGGVVSVDFADKDKPEFHAVDFDFAKAGYALCIIDSGSNHADLTDDYSAIPEEMKAVAGALGKEVLSQVDESEFIKAIPSIRKQVGDRAVMRALHYYSDNNLVGKQAAALENGNFDEFLRLVNSSGNSSFKYLQNVDTYKDSMNQPVALALAAAEMNLKGRGASRVHGGGFAGAIQAFVPVDILQEFKEGMDHIFGTGACRVTSIRPIGGCKLI